MEILSSESVRRGKTCKVNFFVFNSRTYFDWCHWLLCMELYAQTGISQVIEFLFLDSSSAIIFQVTHFTFVHQVIFPSSHKDFTLFDFLLWFVLFVNFLLKVELFALPMLLSVDYFSDISSPSMYISALMVRDYSSRFVGIRKVPDQISVWSPIKHVRERLPPSISLDEASRSSM